MRIHVKTPEHSIRLVLPSYLLFSSCSAWLGETLGRKYAPEAMADIPPGALPKLCRELRRLKWKRGALVLVEVETPDGQTVKITL